MIAHLTGSVTALGATWIVVDLGGFGVKALCTPAAAASARLGETITLATSLVVREDSLTLFAFTDADERDAFEIVQSVSGIGPKIAQAIVSVLPPEQLRAAIESENLTALTKVPGIGRKGAQRLVIELKGKLNGFAGGADEPAAQPEPETSGPAWGDQVASGLESLGWSSKDAAAAVERVVPQAEEHPEWGVGELMKAALRSLARN